MSSSSLLLLLLASLPGPEGYPMTDPADDFSPLLGLFALIAFAVMLVLIGIGMVLAVFLIVGLGILTMMGIVSTSLLAGLLRRRVSAALRTFLYLFL